MFEGVYEGQSVFITGHTGFKGSWLALWLSNLGAKVTGFALSPPSQPSHWENLSLDISSVHGDIRDKASLLSALKKASPKIVFHCAAQALVKHSYEDPLETWSTNVMGTATLLEACRAVDSIEAIVILTTDKVYQDQKWSWGYREIDSLGGYDPYSASKAACEILVSSYRNAFFKESNCLIASARAGNVIGGGDWAEDRLIPDLIRSLQKNQPLKIRAPHSIRPWQHVLDCLHGYLLLGKKLLEKESSGADCWNFGPSQTENWSVIDILQFLHEKWSAIDWVIEQTSSFHETFSLSLDSTRARRLLGWSPVWSLDKALEKTLHWYASWMENKTLLSKKQLEEYMEDALLLGEQNAILQVSH